MKTTMNIYVIGLRPIKNSLSLSDQISLIHKTIFQSYIQSISRSRV